MTLKEFKMVANKCGFKVFKDFKYGKFYNIYFNDDYNNINYFMGQYFDAHDEKFQYAELYPPQNFRLCRPDTSLCGEKFYNWQDMQEQLLKNLFIMKRLDLEYRQNLKDGTAI
jgi:hypothetical protein